MADNAPDLNNLYFHPLTGTPFEESKENNCARSRIFLNHSLFLDVQKVVDLQQCNRLSSLSQRYRALMRNHILHLKQLRDKWYVC